MFEFLQFTHCFKKERLSIPPFGQFSLAFVCEHHGEENFFPDQVVGPGFKVSVNLAIVIKVPDPLQNCLCDQQ